MAGADAEESNVVDLAMPLHLPPCVLCLLSSDHAGAEGGPTDVHCKDKFLVQSVLLPGTAKDAANQDFVSIAHMEVLQ